MPSSPTPGAARPIPDIDKASLKVLRQQAHALKPVVRLGQHGLTDAVLAELDIALAHHELVKVKLAADDGAARAEQLAALMQGCGAALVQRIGHTATLYRRKPPAASTKRTGGDTRRRVSARPAPRRR